MHHTPCHAHPRIALSWAAQATADTNRTARLPKQRQSGRCTSRSQQCAKLEIGLAGRKHARKQAVSLGTLCAVPRRITRQQPARHRTGALKTAPFGASVHERNAGGGWGGIKGRIKALPVQVTVRLWSAVCQGDTRMRCTCTSCRVHYAIAELMPFILCICPYFQLHFNQMLSMPRGGIKYVNKVYEAWCSRSW